MALKPASTNASSTAKLVASSAVQPKTFAPSTSGAMLSSDRPRRRSSMAFIPKNSNGRWDATRPDARAASAGRPQVAMEALPVLHIEARRMLQGARLLRRDFPHDLARRAHHQRIVGDLLALGDQAVRADQAVLPDLGPIQDDGADADQRVVADRAPVKHHHVADG